MDYVVGMYLYEEVGYKMKWLVGVILFLYRLSMIIFVRESRVVLLCV